MTQTLKYNGYQGSVELDLEERHLHGKVYRGLFKTASGKTVNADINGSLNIIKKHLITKEAWNDQIWSDLVEASSTPHVPKFTPDY